MEWSQTKIEFPKTKEGTILNITINQLGSKKVINILPNCSCTNFRFENKVLSINWKTSIRKQDRYAQTSITIEYSDGSVDDIELSTNLFV